MKQKIKLLKSLDEFTKIFGDDAEVERALALLRDRVNQLSDVEETAQSSSVDTSTMVLPSEIRLPHQVALFCDGACRGNPGPGAWAGIGQGFTGEIWFESSGFETRTTNNRMEMLGSIESLQSLKNVLDEKFLLASQTEVFIYTDSKYVVEGATKWIKGWQAKGWKKADGKEVANIDLWQSLVVQLEGFKKVSFQWIKGHAGHPQNERCDQMANQALNDAGL